MFLRAQGSAGHGLEHMGVSAAQGPLPKSRAGRPASSSHRILAAGPLAPAVFWPAERLPRGAPLASFLAAVFNGWRRLPALSPRCSSPLSPWGRIVVPET